MLSFNIFCNDTPINTVNILKAYVTVPITSDGNTKKNLIFTTFNNTTTLKDDIQDQMNNKKEDGMNIKIVLDPETCKTSETLFESTFWKTSQYFIVKSEYKELKYLAKQSYEFDHFMSDNNLVNFVRPIGVNTIGSSLMHPTHDLRGDVPNPMFIVYSL